MHGELKKDVQNVFKKLCEIPEVYLIEGKFCGEPVRMHVAIPFKQSISGLYHV